MSAVLAAIGLLAMGSQLFAMDEAANSVILLIGLAVGVDYSLFFLKREREERAAGKCKEAALEAAAATSGRAVLISGLTVIAALAGMFLGGGEIWTSIAIGTIMVVAIAVAGSLTVLPATLSWLGDRVERGRFPLLSRRSVAGESRIWGAILSRALRRPAVSVALAGGLLAVLSVPAFLMKTELGGVNDLPRSLEIMQTYDRIQESFPGGPTPAVVAVGAPDVGAADVRAAIAGLKTSALATGLMAEPITIDESRNGRVALVSIPLAGTGTDADSYPALAALASRSSPRRSEPCAAWRSPSPARPRSRATSTTSWHGGCARDGFRPPDGVRPPPRRLPLSRDRGEGDRPHLLSVGAAYGLLVAVFQWGWGERLLGFESTAAIVAWIPLFLFVILFGPRWT